LDPFKAKVDKLLSEGVWNARVILDEIEPDGYTGKITVLREYIAPKRALRQSRATVRFETGPAEQLQNDWGELEVEIAGERVRVYFQVNVLGYSRRFHFWCTDSLDAEHTYEGLVRSCEYLGGVPEEVLFDNQKSVVLSHPNGGPARFNERLLDLAGQYGFTPKACRPYRAQTKGKTERMVDYVKDNFFQRYRSFESWAHLNQLAEKWLAEVADPRVHGTHKEVVLERFERERPLLGPLPSKRFDSSYRETRQVAWDQYIDVDGNRYSVPDGLGGQGVVVRIGLDDLLRIYSLDLDPEQDEPLAIHRLRPAREGWVTVPEHHARLWQETLRQAQGDALQVEQRPLAAYEEAASWS
jgi:transposase